MKRLLSTLAVVMLFILTATGQVPKSFKYQTVLRNSQGQVLANQQVDLTLEILRGTVLGPVVCSETYTPTTNEYGLINMEVGSQDQAGFEAINWAIGPYFLRVSVFGTVMGTSELLSVPYALYAERSGSSNGGGSNDTVIIQSQWNDCTAGIYYDEGNVGIRTMYPSSNLQIEGVSNWTEDRDFLWLKNNSTDDLSDVYMKLSSGDESYTSFHHRGASYSYGGTAMQTALWWNHGLGMVLRTSHEGLISFEFYNGSALYEAARITGEGYVGIGTEEPERPLHISDVMRLEPRNEAPANPSEGDIYMDGSDHHLKVFDGTTWQSCW